MEPLSPQASVDVKIFPRSVSFEIVEEDSHWTNVSLTQGEITTIHDNDQWA